MLFWTYMSMQTSMDSTVCSALFCTSHVGVVQLLLKTAVVVDCQAHVMNCKPVVYSVAFPPPV